MKNFDEMIAKLLAKKQAEEEQRQEDIAIVADALHNFKVLSDSAVKELQPAIKRLEMFVSGERYTRTKKD